MEDSYRGMQENDEQRADPASTDRADEPSSGPPARRSRLGLVPADYAEKTMSSLMSLHEDLMAEKERALDVTRRLMAAQQDRAELESYVRLLEVELQRRGGPSLGTLRVGEKGGLESATETVLRSLATGPLTPAAPAPATEPAAPVTSPTPAPVALATTTLVPAESPSAEAPRPPRPSASYRAPVAPGAPPQTQTQTRSRTPATATTSRSEPVSRIAGEEEWRQW